MLSNVYIGLLGLIYLIFSSFIYGLFVGLIATFWAAICVIISSIISGYVSIRITVMSIVFYFIIGIGLGRVSDIIMNQRKVIEKNKEKLKAQKKLLKGVINGISDIIAVQRPDHTIELCNKAGYKILANNPQDTKAKKCFELLGRDKECQTCATRKAKKTKKLETIEKYIPELDMYLNCRSNPVLDESGNIIYIVEQLRDISARKTRENKIRYLSFHDQLTGLYNRRYFENEMKRLSNSRKLPISIIVADIDGLKKINDKYGHKKGDEHIKISAEILKSISRKEDIVARIGGDEFVIILPETNNNIVKDVSERVLKQCNRLNKKLEVPVSISVGWATKEKEGQDLEDMFNKADRMMYQNKYREK